MGSASSLLSTDVQTQSLIGYKGWPTYSGGYQSLPSAFNVCQQIYTCDGPTISQVHSFLHHFQKEDCSSWRSLWKFPPQSTGAAQVLLCHWLCSEDTEEQTITQLFASPTFHFLQHQMHWHSTCQWHLSHFLFFHLSCTVRCTSEIQTHFTFNLLRKNFCQKAVSLPACLHVWCWLGFFTKSFVTRQICINLCTRTGTVQLSIPFPNDVYQSPTKHHWNVFIQSCALHLTLYVSMYITNAIFTHCLGFYISLRA